MSCCVIFYWLNMIELNVVKVVTVNDFEANCILPFS